MSANCACGSGHQVLLSAEVIAGRVGELAAAINTCYRDEELTVVALVNGAMIFAADLVRKLTMPVRLDTFALASYHGHASSGRLDFRSRPKLPLSGKHVLLVDDILDTGLTLSGVGDYLEMQEPLSVRICVLLKKEVSCRDIDIEVDWYGFKIPDVFVYGYGLDENEFFRNLPFIAQFEGS
ncbi:MAG: hypoxanthine phosphoribosyltransferase [Victivallales bacterium]|nr:hypoxanthine phosphoribosyltransferase [Victivallales bacterium]